MAPTSTTPTAMDRYSYAELKRAQAQCAEKAVDAALQACGKTSEAQKEVFKAHVNDLCASVFTNVLRQYDPVSKENVAPVDAALLARVHELEEALKQKEQDLQDLREKVPRFAAEKTREELQRELKRSSDVLLVASDSTDSDKPLDIEEEHVERMKETYESTSKSIVAAASKLDRALSQTTETITVVERAMKRPKTAIDMAMEKSPAKLNLTGKSLLPSAASLNEPEHGSQALRTRLAMQLAGN